MKWIVFDYGNVLSKSPPEADVEAMVRESGADPETFREGYWKHRHDFDLGTLTPREYWSAVLGRAVAADEAARLDALDVAGWSHPEAGTVALLGELLAAGRPVGLLSNAPASQADGLDQLPWIAAIPHRVYSGRIGMAKPDRAIYDHLAREIGADPAGVVFVDDRPDNVAGARAAGMTAVVFTTAAALRADLGL
ncbi:HAD family hydrolase [Nonomuraea rhodomycinica]|uniref:HAD family phosphatase n=1 Tax=Nonomuraea rhodomycinica TaxID=1712872 RepID=A0A7Y6IJD8_9ACTN|nr:HAD family phosphatase [Nonomuraea rhodomycinica]NUW39266.1 HAD family phosphatase [Nonomuraea rhodomycinica]